MIDASTETFYRVSLKAVILRGNKLLVFKADDLWEMPGGGWDHAEDIVQGVTRELREEINADIRTDGKILFTYKNPHPKGYHKLSLAVAAELLSDDFAPCGDDIQEARFVTKEELLSLPFQPEEASIKDCVHLIWPD